MEQQEVREEESPKRTPQKLTFTSTKDYCKQTRELLRQQEQSEIELFNQITKNKTIAEIQSLGYGLSNMLITSTKRGYYGKTVLSLTKAYHSEKHPHLLPQDCKIQVGDDVALYRNNSVIADGVVSKRIGPKLQISTRKQLQDDNDLQGVNCNIILKWNEVTFNRYFKALDALQKSQSPLLPIFFPPALSTAALPRHSTHTQAYHNPKLNEEQNESVQRCMKEQIFLLHGPPGTGKTTTVCEVIVEAVKRGFKILACGPSNIAVDNIVEGLAGRVPCLRIGNPARIIESVLQRCLDYQIAQNSNAWKNEVKKLQSLRKKVSKGGTKQQRRQLWGQIRQLKDQIYRLQQQVIQQLLQETPVICATNVGAADRVFHRYLPKQIFDLVVIDQCGQALQVSCWIPLLKGRRVLLAGDHKQLPPTIQSNENSLLSYTLFTRAMEELVHIQSTMLKVQYRMNSAIMGWSNQQFYQGKLRAHSSVQAHTLKQLCEGVRPEEESLLFIDTAGCGMGEEGGEKESKMNVGEADLVLAIYRKLISYGVESKYIAILTPYSKQVALIKSLIGERGLPPLDVSTVDGIQGRQKQCILISMVRSNSKRQIGFLRDWRRMNVAVTRARRMLVLVGNIQCVTKDPHIKALVEWVDKHGHISSAEEFRTDQTIRFGVGVSDKIQVYQKEEGGSKKEEGAEKAKKKKKKDKNKEGHEDKQKKEHTEQEQQAVKSHFRKVFQQIERQITINNATAFERKMIHQIAEEMGLCHETAEDKKFIKVWKKLTNQEITQHYAELDRVKKEEQEVEEKRKQKAKMQKAKKENRFGERPTSNKMATHLSELVIDDDSEEEEQIKPQSEEQKVEEEEEVKDESKKGKKKKKKGKPSKQQEQEEDIEALMRQFNADQPQQDKCYKCNKKITSVTAVCCKYCNINYCRQHLLAEEHGCGEAAKVEAKRVKPTEKQLEDAAAKLKQKIKEQEEGRKKKPKEQKKK